MKKIEKIHTITAEWLFAKNDDGEKRHWIKGKWFYGTKKHYMDSDNAIKSKTGYAPEKTRFLGYCQNKYAFKIVCPELLGNYCGWSHD